MLSAEGFILRLLSALLLGRRDRKELEFSHGELVEFLSFCRCFSSSPASSTAAGFMQDSFEERDYDALRRKAILAMFPKISGSCRAVGIGSA